MSVFPQVQFVSSPDESATVRFDFNTAGEWADGETWPAHDGWSLGAPSLQGEPDGIGTEYGFRDLTFNLVVKGTAQSVSAKASALARELQRETNWLRFQLAAASDPVWFKTYRSAPSALDFELVRSVEDSAVNLWGIGISLDADPFAYGARETALSAVTVGNDPATGCKVALPAIKGDAPVPLVVDLAPSVALNLSQMMVMATTPSRRASPVVGEYPYFVQYGTGDSATVTNGTAPVVSSASWSGGSARDIQFDSAPTSLLARVTSFADFAAGTYRLMVRVAPSDAAATFQIQGYVYDDVYGDIVTIPVNSANPRWVDAGLVTTPLGMPKDVPADRNLSSRNVGLAWRAARTSGAGSLRIDAAAVLPVDLAQDSESRVLWSAFTGTYGPSSSRLARVDSEAETVALITGDPATTYSYYTTSRVLRGGFPLAWPGRDNTLVIFQQTSLTNSAVTADDIAQSTVVTVSYRPRFLYLGAS